MERMRGIERESVVRVGESWFAQRGTNTIAPPFYDSNAYLLHAITLQTENVLSGRGGNGLCHLKLVETTEIGQFPLKMSMT